MYRNIIYKSNIETKNYPALREKDKLALAKFRNIDLKMTTLGWHIHQSKMEPSDLTFAIRSMVKILNSRVDHAPTMLTLTFATRTTTTHNSSNAYYSINYHVRCNHGLFHPCKQHLPGNLDEQEEELKAAWMRAHLQFLVSRVRDSLERTAPFVTLKTNVDETGHNVRVQRVDEFTVKFKNLNTRKEGTLKVKGTGGRKVRVQYGSGWDKSLRGYV
jgi:hypothetical protein